MKHRAIIIALLVYVGAFLLISLGARAQVEPNANPPPKSAVTPAQPAQISASTPAQPAPSVTASTLAPKPSPVHKALTPAPGQPDVTQKYATPPAKDITPNGVESAKSAPADAKATAATSPGPKKKEKVVKKMFANFEVTFGKSHGKFKALLYHTDAKKTVENFTGLTEGTKETKNHATGEKEKKPFYNGLTFHRVIKNFMIQGGCPIGNGRGGPGYTFADEITAHKFDKPGILAMANAGPNTNGSQFFITVQNERGGQLSNLDGKYSIFGEIVDGMAVVEEISRVKTDPRSDQPVEPVTINKITIEKN